MSSVRLSVPPPQGIDLLRRIDMLMWLARDFVTKVAFKMILNANLKMFDAMSFRAA